MARRRLPPEGTQLAPHLRQFRLVLTWPRTWLAEEHSISQQAKWQGFEVNFHTTHLRIHSTTPPASPIETSTVPIRIDAGASRSWVRIPSPSRASSPRMRRAAKLVTPLTTNTRPNTTRDKTTALDADSKCPDADAAIFSKGSLPMAAKRLRIQVK